MDERDDSSGRPARRPGLDRAGARGDVQPGVRLERRLRGDGGRDHGAVRRRPRPRSGAGLDRGGRRRTSRLHRLHAATTIRRPRGSGCCWWTRSTAGSDSARDLVETCVDFARAAGYARMRLWTTGNLHSARRLYEAVGFVLTDEQPAPPASAPTWSARTGSYHWPTRVRLPPFGGSLVGQNLTVIVLAAGGGTRMKSKTMKVLHQVGGRSMIGHVLNAVQAVEPQRVVAVVGHQREQVGAHIQGAGARVRARGPGGAARHRRRRTRRDRGGRRASAAPSSSPPATPRCCAARACARSRRSTRRRSAR